MQFLLLLPSIRAFNSSHCYVCTFFIELGTNVANVLQICPILSFILYIYLIYMTYLLFTRRERASRLDHLLHLIWTGKGLYQYCIDSGKFVILTFLCKLSSLRSWNRLKTDFSVLVASRKLGAQFSFVSFCCCCYCRFFVNVRTLIDSTIVYDHQFWTETFWTKTKTVSTLNLEPK